MVKFSYATPDPEAVVIELADTLVAIVAVSASVGLLEVACQAESFGWEHHWGRIAHRLNWRSGL